MSNGYGHLFRSIELINFFLKKKNNLNVNLLCSNNHFSKVSKEKILNKKVNIFPIIPNYDLRTNTYDKLLKLYNFKISKKIIDNTDIFISIILKISICQKYYFFTPNFSGGCLPLQIKFE